ncbi:hypothetical protein ACWT_4892 [Actinoplanes sp. SE50]|nr:MULTISPECIES: hypothetical protein [unclassified Actinoplanes]AEV85911.1 hypothetical protein ACPL_5022 [Actinoplanes sp. SE50/110]ATO84307.1 hypothetical protein ACWT_4892 [Actinoplanes sp. SE50]SLM01717.1 hypothetical protein ACSP50_4955 [Actinoplanes sp. SE50/110]
MAEAARQVDTAAADPRTASRRLSNRALVAAAVAVVVVVALGAAFLPRGGHGKPEPAAAEPAAGALPDGFAACGAGICPAQPMCWSGLTQIGAQALPPAVAYCPGTHVWETFAVLRLPAGPPVMSADAPLIEQADVAKACSAAELAAHSIDPGRTRGWRRDAWPVQSGTGWLLHCMAQPKTGSSVGAAFRA